MMPKFIVRCDEEVYALKYNFNKKELVIGGHISLGESMVIILTNFFQKQAPEPKRPQSTKVRFAVSCSYNDFIKGKQLMEENMFYFTEVNDLGTIMR